MKNMTEYEKNPVQGPSAAEHTKSRRVYIPRVDIIDTKAAVVLYADMPGVDEGSVDVTIEKNVLNISGTVKPPEFQGMSIAYAEYGVGDYDRSFTISDDIDRGNVEALVQNGVLKLVLHKAPEAAVRKITVRAAG
jgi:HSP20 family molecular chaperone IbpA